MGDVTVTQADREAAVDIFNVILHDWHTQHMLDGMEDECYVIQAFARHRTEATRALTAEVEARLNKMRDKMEEASKQADLTTDQLANLWGTISGIDVALSLLNKEPGA